MVHDEPLRTPGTRALTDFATAESSLPPAYVDHEGRQDLGVLVFTVEMGPWRRHGDLGRACWSDNKFWWRSHSGLACFGYVIIMYNDRGSKQVFEELFMSEESRRHET